MVTRESLKPVPEKVNAVLKIPKPDNVKAVRRLCGFVNYLARFLPKLSDVMEPLRQLTCKEAIWQWKHEHEEAFSHIKKMVTTVPLLKYYDPTDELIIQCDASEKGLGAALMQREQSSHSQVKH